MKINITPAGIFIAGLVFALYSSFRYYVLFPDIDRAITYPLLGLSIMILGLIINQFKNFKSETEENIKKTNLEVFEMGAYLDERLR